MQEVLSIQNTLIISHLKFIPSNIDFLLYNFFPSKLCTFLIFHSYKASLIKESFRDSGLYFLSTLKLRNLSTYKQIRKATIIYTLKLMQLSSTSTNIYKHPHIYIYTYINVYTSRRVLTKGYQNQI